MSKQNYRKIYEQHYGSIPKDEDGRTYDIHHLDGDRSNNNPENLVALSIKDHYDVHYKQQDYGACWKLSKKMKMLPEELSLLSKMIVAKQFEEGTHPFIGLNEKRIKEGTHHFIGMNEKRLKDGTHHFLSENHPSKVRVRNGTHHFCDPDFQKSMYDKALAKGRHTSQMKKSCVWCGKECSSNIINRHQKSCVNNPNPTKTKYNRKKETK